MTGPKKKVIYKKERQEILQKILDIIEINDKKTTFNSDDFEKDEDKKKQIMELIPDIKKYFSVSGWTYFRRPVGNPEISITRAVLKDMDYSMVYQQKKRKIGGEYKIDNIYHVYPKESDDE